MHVYKIVSKATPFFGKELWSNWKSDDGEPVLGFVRAGNDKFLPGIKEYDIEDLEYLREELKE